MNKKTLEQENKKKFINLIMNTDRFNSVEEFTENFNQHFSGYTKAPIVSTRTMYRYLKGDSVIPESTFVLLLLTYSGAQHGQMLQRRI